MGRHQLLVDKYSSQHKRSRMSTQDQNSQQCFPQLCKNGCGFFSSIDSKGFCSVCYKDYLKKEAATDSASVETSSKEEVPSTVSESMSQLTLEESKDTKKKKNRCLSCKKKLGLTGFSCRCGGLYCAIHRYSDKHDCSFDYKAMGEKEISENNPLIVAQKVAKI